MRDIADAALAAQLAELLRDLVTCGPTSRPGRRMQTFLAAPRTRTEWLAQARELDAEAEIVAAARLEHSAADLRTLAARCRWAADGNSLKDAP